MRNTALGALRAGARAPLAGAMLAAGSCCATAQVPPAIATPAVEPPLQFDMEMLRARGLSPAIVEYFRQGARFQPGVQPVTFTVNGNDMGRKSVVIDGTGRLCFTPALIGALGLRQPAQQDAPPGATTTAAAHDACPDYRDHSPRTQIVLRPSEGAVDLTVPPEDVLPTAEDSRAETGGIGAMLNYRAYAYDSRTPGGTGSTSRYLNTEVGFNAGDWIARSQQTYSASDGVGRFKWQSAYAQKTFTDAKQVLQLGRITTLGSLFAGLPINGAQWFPERGLRQLHSYPVSGVAATRARVEIRQNGMLLYSTVVPPGPFTLTDYPLVDKGSDLQVRILEEPGGERVVTVPASSLLLASDNTQNDGFYVAAGRLWNAGSAGAEAAVPVVTGGRGWVVGPVSGTLGGLLSRNYGAAGVAANWRFLPGASVFAQLLASRDGAHGLGGAQGSAAFAWMVAEGLSVGLSGNLRTAGYRTLQAAANATQAAAAGQGTRSQLGVTTSWSLGRWGALSAGVTQVNDFSGEPSRVHSLGWGVSWRSLNLQLSLSRSAARTADTGTQRAAQRSPTQAYLNLSIPLDIGATLTSYARRTGDATRHGVGIDQRLNDWIGYRLSGERPAAGAALETSGSVGVVPRYVSLSLGMSDRPSGRSYYADASGSVLATALGIGFSPYAVQDTFGGISTGNVIGLKVNTPQGPVWSGPGGFAAVPSLLAYQESRLEASLTDAGLDVDVDRPLQTVQAARGAVLNVEFGAMRVRRVLLAVVDASGQPLASGLPVLRGGNEFFSSTAQGGWVMVSRMVEGDILYVELGDGRRCMLQEIRTRPREDGELFESGKAVCK